MCSTYCMTSFSRTFYIFSYVSWLCDYYCDYVIWCDWCVTVWSHHSNPNPRFIEKKNKLKKKKKNKLHKKASIQTLHVWHRESKLIRIIWSVYYSISVFVRRIQYNVNKWLRGFLNEKNVKLFISFQNSVYESSVLSNILQKNF